MQQNSKASLSLLLACLVTGCTTVRTEHELPAQSVQAPASPGMTRVVFYNDTAKGLLPASSRIGIRVDGKGVAAPASGEFVRVDLAAGRHHLDLSHSDTLNFHDEYSFTVTEGDLYVRVFRTPLTTNFELSGEQPSGFSGKFRPAISAAR